MQQRIVHFRGTVQGVGFRYTTRQTAQKYDIHGYVKNLPDGRVQCLIEGEADEIDAFLDDLGERMSGYIRETTQQTAPAGGNYHGFQIAY